jgi:predicted dehydrogenase
MTHDPKPQSQGTTRRDFLKASAAGTATLAGLSLARSAHADGDDVIKIGMIGSGGRCAGAASQSLMAGPDVRLVAMSDVFEDRIQVRRKALQEQWPDQVMVDDDHCFVGLDGYKHVIECCDVVMIACASKFHPMYAEAAIKAGKHVFVEKPHGIDPAGVRHMQEVCELANKKGLSIVSGLQSRYSAAWQETVKRIHDGIIGDIVSIQSMFLRGPYRLEAREEGLSELQFHFRNWYHFCWLSGDDVIQSLVHNMDRVSWILKEEMPEWAFGLGGRSSSFGEIYGDMFDHHTVVYEYESGARVYALCRTQKGCYNNSSDIIMGTKGTCYLGQSKIVGETDWQFPRDQKNNPYEAEQKALIDAVRSGEPVNSGAYMANSTMVTVLGQLACYNGNALNWEEVANSDFQFGPPPEETCMDMEPPTKPEADGNYPLPHPGVFQIT